MFECIFNLFRSKKIKKQKPKFFIKKSFYVHAPRRYPLNRTLLKKSTKKVWH